MTIGERIKNRRTELGLSVDFVAAKLNKNRATIYRYESDEIENLPITILEPLAVILQSSRAAPRLFFDYF
jgi:transcriptional regulator with XRE-family HTH domain